MIVNFLGFDIEKYMKRIFAPYAKPLSISILLATTILSLIVLVSPIRDAIGFHQWGEWTVIVMSLAWFVGVIVSFLLILQSLGITLNQFGNFFVALDVCTLVAIIVITSLMPGQQICNMEGPDCTLLDNLVWIFAILQPFVIGIYLRIKFAYATGLDSLLILRKIFGPKS
jgi:hypothetical protein